MEVETDASLEGWGAFCQGQMTGDRWSEKEEGYHINFLKLQVVNFALRLLVKTQKDICILVNLETFRKHLKTRKLSEEAIAFISSSWTRKKTTFRWDQTYP